MADPQNVDDLMKGGAGGAGLIGAVLAIWRLVSSNKLGELSKTLEAQGKALERLGVVLDEVKRELSDVRTDLAVAQKDVVTRAEFEQLRTALAVQSQQLDSLKSTVDQVVHS
jgi:hypothetical protein